MSPRVAWLSLWLCVAACSSDDDTSVAGNYTVTLVNGNNGCDLPSFPGGAQSTVANVTLTQSHSDVTAVVGGGAGILLDILLGGHSYTGKVTGGDLDLHLFGTRSMNSGNCTYTLNAAIRAVVDGSDIKGQIDYTSATNGNPDCSTIATCDSFQELFGTRT
jgi:hypothetical protein